ncbi:MAG: hypothetical protein AAF573_01395 [Bacteroidota bacterium]
MRNLKYLFSVALLLGLWSVSYAHVGPNHHNKPASATQNNVASIRMDCAQGTSLVVQSINNVRATLLNGGDVWWDLDNGQYVVPKVEPGVPEVSSIFAGAVWIGGFTGLPDNPNLKMAAQTYRTGTRNDFWPGPLTDVGTVGFDTCVNWDKHYRVLGENILAHIQNWEIAKSEGRTELEPNEIPADVLGWPAKGNRWFFDVHGFDLPSEPTSTQGFGFFFDNVDPDGVIPNEIDVYEPHLGDFPRIDITNCDVESLKDAQYADEMYFWIYNDAGGNHTQSQGDQIRMEIQVQSFAWRTNDEINDMTFQRYKLINRAQEVIDSTFFAMWVDPDLGCYTDDYIGCDTTRSLAYVYNEDALDGATGCTCPQAVATYCDKVPLLGVDYFRGPNAPKVRVFDSNGNLVELINPTPTVPADTLVPLGMSSFTYTNSGIGGGPPGQQDPNLPAEFYNLISGSWTDGTPYTFGGDGYNSGGPQVNYAFPSDPDDPTGWSMCTANLPFDDRRTLQASGPFTLISQAVNELIVGVVWVPDVPHACPNISPLLAADDIAQALFDNCFDITDGPDAPDVDFVELDEEIIMILTNGDPLVTNNSREQYSEIDLQAPPGLPDEVKSYKFEGYRIYQLIDANVSPAEFGNDADRSRLLISVDIKNGISRLYNWSPEFNPSDPTNPIWVPSLQNEGVLENGISHTFSITEDLFSDGDNSLVNHKKYYYSVIAYAHNNFEQFDPVSGVGQRRPYLEGRRNIGDGERSSYTVIPRPIVYRKLNASYGDGPVVTRIDGIGVGENNVAMTQETEDAILDGSFNGEITYQAGRSPINVKIINPLEVVNGEFQLTFTDLDGNNDGDDELDSEQYWQLTNLSDPSAPIYSDQTLERLNEQVLSEFGFSITVGQTDDAGDKVDPSNGTIGYEEIYASSDDWFSFIPDDSGGEIFNYLRTSENETDFTEDPEQAFSRFGSFAPFVLNSFETPDMAAQQFWLTTNLREEAISNVVRLQNPVQDLNNVDIVFTSDPTKWSRCVVVETAIPEYYQAPTFSGNVFETEGNVTNLRLRDGASVGIDGQPEGGSDTGMGYFPGYAIDQETGERLNIFFGENSTYFPGGPNSDNFTANGRDMIWNPTDELILPFFDQFPHNVVAGGQHYIYVTKEKYDGCAEIKSELESQSANTRRRAYNKITWSSMAILNEGASLLPVDQGLIPTDLRIQLRVDNPYQVFEGTDDFNGYPTYRFVIDGKAAEDVESEEDIETALDNVNVVPNPYYGYSAYEISQFTNTVKITNLPAKCTVTIYSLDGKFIRQYKRDESVINVSQTRPNSGIINTQVSPALEWDLKNSKGIPIASGVYLIHIDADGLGERVLKWFGVNRKFDPSGL